MGDYGDTSGGNSDQAIRDIIAQLNGSPTDAQVAANLPPPSWAAAPGPPLSLAPPAARPAPDDWAPPAPVFTAPSVTPLGAMAAVPRPVAPALGGVLALPVRR